MIDVAVAGLDAVQAGEWDRLVDRSPSTTVFQRHGWLRAWWDSCAPAGAAPVVVQARRRGELVGGAALFAAAGAEDGPPGPQLRFIGDPHSDYNVFPVAGGDPGTLDAVCLAMEEAIPRGGCALLREVPEASGLATRLRARAGVLGRVSEGAPTVCPRLDLRGDAGRAVLRKEGFRRHARRLSRVGAVTVEHHREAEAIRPHLPGFFDQHVRRWAATSCPSLFLGAHNRRFYAALLDALPGRVVFTVVRLDGRPVAYHFGLLSGRDLLWYKPSFELSLADHSPGQALLYALVEWCLAEGLEGLDFTRGDEAFKTRYASERRNNVPLTVHRSPVARSRAAVTNLTRRAVGKAGRVLRPGRGVAL